MRMRPCTRGAARPEAGPSLASVGGGWCGEPGERGGTTPPVGGGTEGAWSSDSRERASGRLEVGPSVGGEEPGGQGASH